MTHPSVRKAASAIRNRHEHDTKRHVRQIHYGEVTATDPTKVEVHGRNIVLDGDDDLVFPQGVPEDRISVGDTLIVVPMPTGEWVVLGAASDVPGDADPSPGGPAGGQLDGEYPDPDLKSNVAGDGLVGAGGSPLAVGEGAGITVGADDVSVDTTVIATRAYALSLLGGGGGVRDIIYYGATGDGVTDDTDAFIAALAAQDTVIIPNGTYLITSSAIESGGETLDGNKVLLGESRDGAIIKCADEPGSTFWFRVTAGHNQARHLTFQGPDTYQADSLDNFSIFGWTDADGASLECVDCNFFRIADVAAGWNGRVQPMRFEDCVYDADHIGDDNNEGSFIGGTKSIGDIEVVNCHFKGGGCQGDPYLTHAFYVGYQTPFLLEECTFEDWTLGSYVKVYGDSDGTPPTPARQKIRNCTFGPMRPGFEAQMMFTPTGCIDTIEGCDFDQGDADGTTAVLVWGEAHFVGCTFRGGLGNYNTLDIVGAGGGGLADGKQVTFEDCHFPNNNLVNIGIDADDVDLTIANGSMRGDTYYKVFVGGTGSTVRFRNVVTDGTGIHISYGANGDLLTVTDSEFMNATYAIEVQSGQTLAVLRQRSNTFTSIGGTPVNAGGGAGTITTENSRFNFGYADRCTTTVTAASTIDPGTDAAHCLVTGNTNISTITAADRGVGRTVIFQFSGTPTVTDGSNLKLNGNFVASADDTLTLTCDGTNWRESGRSPN